MAGFAGLMKDLPRLRERMEMVKVELGRERVTAETGGGAVRATADGMMRVISVEIEPALLAGLVEIEDADDRALGQDLITGAVNQALERSREVAQRVVSEAAADLGISRLIDAFTMLPGIGRRSAERMAFYILKCSRDDAMQISTAIADVKDNVRPCNVCANLTDGELCSICADVRRDATTVMVVEQPRDLISLEQTAMFRGVYHVLTGRLDPLGGVERGDLTIAELLARVDDPARNCRGVAVEEVILGLNPDLEGDSTALFLAEELERRSVKVTRLARGLPTGSQLEYVSRAVLADAIQGRRGV
ncbi:MAG: recombination mediator RecR [Planctomycetota bacterium]